ncbi:MAG: hypothetical protein KFB96_24500 [Thiocapsa sp.]|uniref:hypothetical protein n=1 Tax=Thiocapsa sp. TaxID=2024551 RepID=UPI001BD0F64F|nr:hypothetical protein [Thiocapsa sp.]QVL48684.1 MAG: hypothetical protein KFB96_24500 [Thiocapsa sp.]
MSQLPSESSLAMAWIRVDLSQGSRLLVDDLMDLPAKLRIRRLLVLIHAAGCGQDGWPSQFEMRRARVETTVADSGLPTIRLRLGADCRELEKYVRSIPRGSRATALLALAESGLRTLSHREIRDRLEGASVSRQSSVTRAATADNPVMRTSIDVQDDLATDGNSADWNEDALDFAINALLGLTPHN